jgi:hypothetical protein
MVSSTVSAMASREASEERIPSCPWRRRRDGDGGELARRAAALLDAVLHDLRLRFSAMLQGAASFQQVATPTQGWWISSSVIPIA